MTNMTPEDLAAVPWLLANHGFSILNEHEVLEWAQALEEALERAWSERSAQDWISVELNCRLVDAEADRDRNLANWHWWRDQALSRAEDQARLQAKIAKQSAEITRLGAELGRVQQLRSQEFSTYIDSRGPNVCEHDLFVQDCSACTR